MAGLKDTLGSLAQSEPQFARLVQATVTVVQEDGTVNVDYLDAIYSGVPRLDSYSAPAEGESVAMLVVGASMIVLGKYATNQTPPVPSGSTLTVEPYEVVGYENDTIESDQVKQAHDLLEPEPRIEYSGGWFYDDDIAVALAGVVPRAMHIYLVRDAEDQGDDRVAPRLLPHGWLTAPINKPQETRTPHVGPTMQRGQALWTTLPASWYARFVSGEFRGVMLVDSGNPSDPENLMTMDANSGTISITK